MEHNAYSQISQKKRLFTGMEMAVMVRVGAVTAVLRPGIVDSIG